MSSLALGRGKLEKRLRPRKLLQVIRVELAEEEYDGLKVDDLKVMKLTTAALLIVRQYQLTRMMYNFSVVQFDNMDVAVR